MLENRKSIIVRNERIEKAYGERLSTVSNFAFTENKPAFRQTLLTNRQPQLPFKRGRKRYF